MIGVLIGIALAGLAVSIYGYFVENKIQADSAYKPLCDISDMVSCSKPIRSEYGKLFMVSNTVIGMIYYTAMIALAFFECLHFLFPLAAIAVCVSVVYAYILFIKIRSFCLICVSVYIINIALLVVTYLYV